MTDKPNYRHSAIPKNRASGSVLVMDGSEVKLRLLAERQDSKSVVHVDWVRFTVMLRNAPAPSLETIFPLTVVNVWDEESRNSQLQSIIRDLPDSDYQASVQAHELATQTAVALGDDFSVHPEPKKGLDFYKFRWSIQRHGAECGWVGYLSSSESPRQQSQSKTIHVNLFGAGCTFAAPGWKERIADIVDNTSGVLTRCDLALDFFDGIPGGLDSIVSQYQSGLCDVAGRKLKSNCVGDWLNGKERSLYFGSKEAGKQTNCYEKGHQLFGVDSGSDWLRVELRYGNKLRVLSSDMLRRPADFFAGASDWHESMIHLADSMVVPEAVPTEERLPLETVEAECMRNVRWMMNTAGPTLAAAINYIKTSDLWSSLEGLGLPGRLKSFKVSEIETGMDRAFSRLTSCGGISQAFA